MEQADKTWYKTHYSFDWWLTVASECAKLGVDKREFTGLVSHYYGDDQNRFEASVAWDVYKLGESSD